MTDIATLPLTLPSVMPGAPAGAGATPAIAAVLTGEGGAPDPFAALLAALTPSADSAATDPTPAMPVAVPTVPTAATKPPTPALPTFAEEQPVAEQEDAPAGDASAGDENSDPNSDENPQLAMMLALVPLPAPVPPPSVLPAATAQIAPQPASAAAISEITLPSASGPKPRAATPPGGDKAAKGTASAGKDTPLEGTAQPTSEAVAHAATDSAGKAADRPHSGAEPTPARNARFAALAARLFGGVATNANTVAGAEAAPIDAPLDIGAASSLPSETRAASAPPPVAITLGDMAARDPRPAAPTALKMPETSAPADAAIDQPRTADTVASLFPVPTSQAAPAPNAPDVGASNPPVDASVTRELSIARDGQWLDTLARDIAATAGKDGQLSFRLDPHHLGSLTVHIRHSDEGASIRMTADTESGRAMLADAQPRLAAEARAHGLSLRETSVDLGGSNADTSQQQAQTAAALAQGQSERRDSRPDEPFINLDAREADEAARGSETGAPSDLYA